MSDVVSILLCIFIGVMLTLVVQRIAIPIVKWRKEVLRIRKETERDAELAKLHTMIYRRVIDYAVRGFNYTPDEAWYDGERLTTMRKAVAEASEAVDKIRALAITAAAEKSEVVHRAEVVEEFVPPAVNSEALGPEWAEQEEFFHRLGATLSNISTGDLWKNGFWNTTRIYTQHDGVYSLYGAAIDFQYAEADVNNPKAPVSQVTRAWIAHPAMTVDDIIRTAHKCLLGSQEHRLDEHFLYEGRRVYDPHRKVT